MDFVENVRDNHVGGHVVGLGFVGQADTVAHHVVAYGDDVLRHNVAALVDEGIGAGGAGKRNRRARRGPEADVGFDFVEAVLLRRARGVDDIDDVAFDFLVKIDAVDYTCLLYTSDAADD